MLGVETSSPDDGWTDKLFVLEIDKWNTSYNDLRVLDGTQWELDYKLKGQDTKHIYGSNAYPENWMKLVELIEEFHPEIDFLCHDYEDEEDELD